MIRVLVVDDDFMVAKVHSGYVERIEGAVVAGVAHSGAEALQRARELTPDVVLLDIYLPDIDGVDLLRRLRADPATADIEVIVITAARDVDTIRAAMRGGALHYLIKPFSYAALAEQLQQVHALTRKLARLDSLRTAGQDDVDDVFGTRSRVSGVSAPLPKGLTEQTANLVQSALEKHPDGLSASECADETRLSRPSARRYLEHFVNTDKAAVKLRYGRSGRPERQYQWLR